MVALAPAAAERHGLAMAALVGQRQCRHRDAELAAQHAGGSQQRRCAHRAEPALERCDVDQQLIDAEPSHCRQLATARAEIGAGQAKARGLQPRQAARPAAAGHAQRRLVDRQHDPRRRQAVRLAQIGQDLGQIRLVQLAGQQADREVDRLALIDRPAGHLAESCLCQPAAQGPADAGRFGQGLQLLRADLAMAWMAPSEVHLHAHQLPLGQRELRHEAQLELAARQRLAQILGQCPLPAQGEIEQLVAGPDRAHAVLTGQLERGHGARQQIARGWRCSRVGLGPIERHAELQGDLAGLAIEVEGCGHGGLEAGAQGQDVAGRHQLVQGDREARPLDPRQHVVLTQVREQAGAGMAQQQVAGDAALVARDRRMLDQLDAEDRDALVLGLRLHQAQMQAIEEHMPARQTGQRVMRQERPRHRLALRHPARIGRRPRPGHAPVAAPLARLQPEAERQEQRRPGPGKRAECRLERQAAAQATGGGPAMQADQATERHCGCVHQRHPKLSQTEAGACAIMVNER